MQSIKPLQVVIVSGGTGRTAEQVAHAAMAQFGPLNVELVLRKNVRTLPAVRRIVQRAHQDGAIICHTVVSKKVRETMVEECAKLSVPVVDVLGPMVKFLDDHLEEAPKNEPGLVYLFNKETYDRMDAVDYTLAHDDGRSVDDLDDADVVLVGVSRASKSVTCFFLAYRGIRAANVPIVPGCDPPEQLLSVDPKKVIGLTVNVPRLKGVRERRKLTQDPDGIQSYTDQREIAREIRTATRLFTKHDWRLIDVSYMATEEVATKVMKMLSE